MKINTKILSIPPYISTSWKNIASLHVENQGPKTVLVITLHSGTRIEIPHLEVPVMKTIFAAHTQYMEHEEKAPQPKTSLSLPSGQPQLYSLDLPFPSGIKELENFSTMLQHNPEQANSPDLPPEILDKITHISQSLGIEDPDLVPKAEPHCNCMYCQIAKAMHSGVNKVSHAQEEEVVTDADLTFKTWDIAQTGDKLFVVSNPLDSDEHYNVFLGEPVGCTCGEKHCEHIRAVLNS